VFLCIAVITLVVYCAYAQVEPAHEWKVTLKVIGEDGNPIVGGDVAVQYTVPTTPDSGDQTFGKIKGKTDTNGVFRASHTVAHGI
jgi:hypothetical protein